MAPHEPPLQPYPSKVVAALLAAPASRPASATE